MFTSKYTFLDFFEVMIGAFFSMLPIFVFRAGENFFINPWVAIMITIMIIIIFIYCLIRYTGFEKNFVYKHVLIDFLICLVLGTTFAILFGLISFEQIFTISFLGGSAVIVTWISLPIALLFDIRNIRNPLDKWGDVGASPMINYADRCKAYVGADKDKCIEIIKEL